MSLLRTLMYWFTGGKRRWFLRRANKLLALTAHANVQDNPGSSDALILHLDDCRNQGYLNADFIRSVAARFLENGCFRKNPAWLPFFRQLPESHLPALFEVHALLGRLAEAIDLARNGDQVETAIGLCLENGSPECLRGALQLAQRQANSVLECKVHQALGEALARAGEWAEALQFFTASGDHAAQSECCERMGDLKRALHLCPPKQDERLGRLIERSTQVALDIAARGELHAAMTALMEVRALLGGEAYTGSVCQQWRGVLERHRAELLAIGREKLRSASGNEADESREHRLARVAFEESAGEWSEAALLLEQTGEHGDRLKASQLWEKDKRYGDAVRALGALAERKEIQLRLAQLRQQGGDAAGAARIFELLQCWSDARRAYDAAGLPSQAADCYLREHGKKEAAHSNEYAGWLMRAGRIDELLALYLECLGEDADNPLLLDRLCLLVHDRRSEIRSPSLREAAASRVAGAAPADLRRRFEQAAPRWLDQARSEIQKRYGRIWGMDLGTSKSAVSLFDLEGRAPVICPHDGKPHFPSTLCLDKLGNEIIGLDALEQLRPDLRGCVEGSKRAMGTRRVYQIGDRRFSPEEVAARLMTHGRRLVEGFLRNKLEERVLELARKALGEAIPSRWIEEDAWSAKTTFSAPEAIVTIPAYFNFDQRRATRDAAEVAGIKLHRLISEPTAACLSAGLTRKRKGHILVVDLGAGTLDVSHMTSSPMETGETLFEVERVFGDSQFGSRDLDAAIEREFLEELKRGGTAELSGLDKRRLRAATEQVKIALSSSNQTSYDLVSFAGRMHYTLELSATRLEALLRSHLDHLTDVCREAIALPIDHLILVGGPMFSPIVRQRIEGLLRRKADAVVDPRTAVAMGAAWQGAVISDHDRVPLLLLDIVPFALGVLVKERSEAKAAVSFHIPRGTRIPHQNRKPYTTTEDNQPAVTVQVFQGLGDSTDPAANSRLALFSLEGLPPAKAGEPKIGIVFDIDANGLLEVTARDESTRRSKSLRIDDTIWLSPSERTDMTSRLTKSQQWALERTELTKLAQTLASLIERVRSLERQQLALTWRSQFTAWNALENPSFDALDAAQQAVLADMYNNGQTSCDRFVVELDRARNLIPRCQRFIDAVREISLFAAEAEVEQRLHGLRELGEQVTRQTDSALTSLEEFAARFQRWSATMAYCATLFGDPRDRLIACHDAGNWQEAVDAFAKAFASVPAADVPLPAVTRNLDGLARLNRREEYRRTIAGYRERLCLQDLDFDCLNEFGRHVQPAIAWVFVGGRATGSGFLAGTNLIVTNLHVVCEETGPVATSSLTVQVGGVPNAVVGMRFPPNPGVDLVVLELSRQAEVRPMRVGYGSLVEIGERVLTIGFPLPEGASFNENILLDHGIVNRIRTRSETGSREFELGLRIFSGMSGGPVFNDRGEVIAISTFIRYQSAGLQGPFVDKSSHAIAADPLHGLLPPPW